jgi:hypothetical protein
VISSPYLFVFFTLFFFEKNKLVSFCTSSHRKTLKRENSTSKKKKERKKEKIKDAGFISLVMLKR